MNLGANNDNFILASLEDVNISSKLQKTCMDEDYKRFASTEIHMLSFSFLDLIFFKLAKTYPSCHKYLDHQFRNLSHQNLLTRVENLELMNIDT